MGSLNLANRLDNIPTPTQSLEALFGAPTDERKVVNLRLCDLEFAEQRTPMNSDDELEEMAESIKRVGVQEPIIVRKMPLSPTHSYDYYEVVNGRNRTAASRLAGKEDIPAIVIKATDAEAQYIIAITTLSQRQHLSICSKAWAYRMQMDAMKRMGGERTDLVSNGDKVNTLEEISAFSSDSRAAIARYIRLTYLTPELLGMMDANKNPLPIRAGVALSYLSEHEQDIIHAYVTEHCKSMSVEQAEQLRKYHEEMKVEVTNALLDKLFGGRSLGASPPRTIAFAKKDLQRIQSIIPPTVQNSKSATTDYIIRALKYYEQHGTN